MSKRLNKYVSACKSVVDMPYNKLNLDNYVEIISKKFNIDLVHYQPSDDGPIRLMCGRDMDARIIGTQLPKNPKSKKIYIVGKGILFDAGGYNIKDEMSTMKCDMAGMATAFAVTAYLKNELGIGNVVAYCPVTTNFLHNNEITPGDYLKIGKKEVEITDTDAEGRLILAEALIMLKPSKQDIVITVATLTGAVGYAVGAKATGVFAVNEKLAHKYIESSKKTKELAWQLPMWNYLQKKYKGKRIKNYYEKVLAGASMASLFVKQFVRHPDNWLHLDIASSAFDETKNKATGQPVKTLIRFIKKLRRK